MKVKLFYLAGLIMLISGCCSPAPEKLPAGDIDIYTKFANEIATLHNTALRPDSKLKYEAALILYKNVDFSFVRDLETLEKIFGANDARLGSKHFEKQTIIYLYRYQDKRIRFVFTRYNNAIISSECTDKTN
ncbi:MAG: hypothetical protein PHH77_00130 [Victivallaceae bacterium]|nr:hypothetical protein [Victivallaceae bacterium]